MRRDEVGKSRFPLSHLNAAVMLGWFLGKGDLRWRSRRRLSRRKLPLDCLDSDEPTRHFTVKVKHNIGKTNYGMPSSQYACRRNNNGRQPAFRNYNVRHSCQFGLKQIASAEKSNTVHRQPHKIHANVTFFHSMHSLR